VGDETADGLVEGRVDEAGLTRGGLGVTGIAVAEQPRMPGAQDRESRGEFGRSPAGRRPGGGDDTGARSGGVVLGKYAAGQEALIVRVREHPQQRRQRRAVHDEGFSSKWWGRKVQMTGGRPAVVSRYTARQLIGRRSCVRRVVQPSRIPRSV
jgi:hypothetical protein